MTKVETKFKGKLLIARPGTMRDPTFAQTVVYLYEQTDLIVFGLILNKPSYLTIDRLQGLRGIYNTGATGSVYRGGPVGEQSLILLHTDEWNSTNTIPVTHGNCISSDELMLDKMVDGNLPACWRLIAGMSTWGVKQLQEELYQHKAWLLVEPNHEIFYNEDEEDQWKMGIQLASDQMMDQLLIDNTVV